MGKKTKTNQLGGGGWKIDAKLRVIANGDTEVNVVRAERCDALSVSKTYRPADTQLSMAKVEAVEAERAKSADPLGRRAKAARPPARGKIKTITSDIYANVFISKHADQPLPASLGGERDGEERELFPPPRCRSRSSRSSAPIRSYATSRWVRACAIRIR